MTPNDPAWLFFDGTKKADSPENAAKREAIREDFLSYQLLDEFIRWFYNLANSNVRLPKMFSGVNSQGHQFIVNLSALPLGIGEHFNFMRFVLNQEACLAFAYKALIGSMNRDGSGDVRHLHVFHSGEAERYFSVEIQEIPAETIEQGLRVVSKVEYSTLLDFHHELLFPHYTASENDAAYSQLWNGIRGTVSWRARGIGAAGGMRSPGKWTSS